MQKLSPGIEAAIHDRTTARTRDILTGHHDSPAKVRKAIIRAQKEIASGKLKPSNERL